MRETWFNTSGVEAGLSTASSPLLLLELGPLPSLYCAFCAVTDASLAGGLGGRLLRSLIHCVRFLNDA